MLNKLLNTSHKDEKRQGGVSWYIQRGRGKEFFLFAFTTVMFFTVVLWSNEPRFGTLSSAQQQFVLSSPASGREYASKSLTVVSNVGGTKHLVDQQSSASAATTTTTTAAAAATERSLAAQKQENLESASSLDQKIYSEEKPKLLVTNNVQKARLATEESFTVEGDSTAQAPPVTQRASVDLSFSKTERSFATQQEEKVSASMSEKKDVTVQEDHSIRAPVLMQTATEDKPQLLNDNVGSMKPKAGQPQQLINNVESTKAKVEPSEDKPQQLTNNIESMKPKVEPAEDKPQQLTDNVENTKSIFEDSSASKGLYSTRTTTQGASMADVPLVVEGGSATQASLTRETVVKDTDNQERVFKADVSKTSDRPVEDMVPSSNVNHKRDDLAESNGHPVEEKASSTTVNLEKVSKDDVAKSDDHPVEEKASSTTFSQEKVSKDVTTSKDQTVEETLPVVQSEDKPQQVTDNVPTTKPMTQESIVQSQGSSAIQSSSPPGEQSVTEKEDKNSASSYEKSGSSWKTVTEEPVAPENSASNEMSGATKMEYKNSTSTYENKDNFGLPQQLSVHNETEDKPQKLTDNVATTKPVAHESIAPPEGSSAIRGSSLPEEPSVIEDHPSATQGAATLEKEEKNLASSYEKKDLSGKTVIEEPATTDISPSNEVSMAMKMEYNNSTSTSENKECNYAKGRWVHDTKRPLYSGSKCKQWLSWMWACRLTTRSDFRFEQYRWQPENCNMPQFDRFSFLERMRNKTIAFMGDSIGRQQFQSLMCMLTGGEDSPEVEDVSHYYGLTTPPGISMKREGAFRFPRTRTTIVYHWSSCLCHLVPLRNSEPNSAIAMHLDRAPYFLRRFLHKLDVLVLNTGHHWNRGKFKSNRWIMYVNGRPNEDRRLFQMANAKNLTIHSLVKWIDSQLASNPNLKVFFRTISPRHFFNGEWNTGGSCENTTPLARGSEVKQEASSDEVTASAVRGTRVKLLDITALSELRDEGHLSKFGYKGDSGVRDCLHWCLPGVPDTWNEILAAQI